jgi:hypothetical protein
MQIKSLAGKQQFHPKSGVGISILLIVSLFALPRMQSYGQMALESEPGAYYVNVAAGPEYKKGKFHQWLFGKNRRKEWTTPVNVPILQLDTLKGGMKLVKKGGGNESKTLQLQGADGKMYALRSVNKSRKAVTPKMFRGTGVGRIIQDGVSMSYPYGCMVVPHLLAVAQIPHAAPTLYYIPAQTALGEYSEVYGNELYFIEERPDGDWSGNKQMGSFSEFISSPKLLKRLDKDNDISFDQHAYVKARLIDLMLGDWDRQPDNWRWGASASNPNHYIPLPRDRDQAFYTRNGKIYNLIIPVSRYKFMQNYSAGLKNVGGLTKQDRSWDQLVTNDVSLEEWISAARWLQKELTDTSIAQAVRGLPPEIYAISGNELTQKLISRRNNLHSYAADFYKVLAANVEINGSAKKEIFHLQPQQDNAIRVDIYRVLANGNKETTPYFSQQYHPQYTQSITINGGEGEDDFIIPEAYKNIRIIRNPGKSSNPMFEREED